jgi:hypothetical protein
MAADLSRQVGDHLYNVLVLNISCVAPPERRGSRDLAVVAAVGPR